MWQQRGESENLVFADFYFGLAVFFMQLAELGANTQITELKNSLNGIIWVFSNFVNGRPVGTEEMPVRLSAAGREQFVEQTL